MNKYLPIATLLFLLSAHSNSAQSLREDKLSDASETECIDILTQSEFSTLNGIDLTQLSSERLGKILVGRECSKNDLETYFTRRNWKISQERSKSSKDSRYVSGRANYVQSYCLEWFFPLGSVLNCRAFAVVYTLDDVVLKIAAARGY